MNTFDAIFPVVEKYARMRLGNNDDLVSTALVLAWWIWSRTSPVKDLPATAYAHAAVRAAWNGRDLPGCGTHAKDAMWHVVSSGVIREVRDRRPGPDRLAEMAEEYLRLWADMAETDAIMALHLLNGEPAKDVAARLGITPGRLTQRRQELRDRWNG